MLLILLIYEQRYKLIFKMKSSKGAGPGQTAGSPLSSASADRHRPQGALRQHSAYAWGPTQTENFLSVVRQPTTGNSPFAPGPAHNTSCGA